MSWIRTAARSTALLGLGALLTAGPALARDEGAEGSDFDTGYTMDTLEEPTAESIFDRYRPVYSSQFGETSLGAYGELIYNNDLDGGRDQLEMRRFVLFLAHDFNDWISLYGEVEVEHADEIFIEQAFVEFRPFEQDAIFRGGVLLLPLSFVNLYHEPTFFYSAERPVVDSVLVPTTLREAGLSVSGTPTEWLSYELMVTNSLALADRNGNLKTGDFDTEGIRGLRQKASRASVNDVAVSGRLTLTPLLGLGVSGSFFTGETGQSQEVTVSLDGEEQTLELPDARITLLETDVRWARDGFDLRGQYVITFVDDADEISRVSGVTVGETQMGFHVEGAYDLLRVLAPSSAHRLHLFYRYSWVDLQSEVPDGFEANPAGTFDEHTVGLAWFPIDQVVAKLDFQSREDDAGETSERVNAALGFSF